MTDKGNLENDAGSARSTLKEHWQNIQQKKFGKILSIMAVTALALILIIAVFGRRTFTDSYQVWNYLQLARRVGRTQEGPVPLAVRVNIDSQWRYIVNTINGVGVPVYLNLSRSNMTNTEFNPGNTRSTLIISLVLPNSVTKIRSGFGIFPNISTIRFPASAEIDEVNPFIGMSRVTFNPRGRGDLGAIENGRVLVRGGNELISFPSARGNVTLDNITIIAHSGFNSTLIEGINLPAVTTVGMLAFGNCENLTTVNLPVATTIGNRAFYGNTSLQTVNLPVANTIGEMAFSGNTNLQTIELPAAAIIGAYAFQGNTSLQTLYIPTIVSIGNRAAANTGNTALTVTVGEQLETVGTWMFYGVTAAKNVIIRAPQGEVAGITAMTNAFRGRGWNEGSFTLAAGVNRNTGRTNWEWRGGQWVQVPIMQWVNNFNTHVNLTVQGL